MRRWDVVRSMVLPALGMSMFWPLFRYVSFFMVLYPAASDVSIGGGHLTVHIVCLFALAVLSCAAFGCWRQIERLLARRRPAVACLVCLAAVGAVLALAVNDGFLPEGWLWASAVCAATGFLAAYLAWASFFSHSFSSADIAVLGASFFASYVLFSHGGLIGGVLDGSVGTVVMPIGTGLAWLLSRKAGAASTEAARPSDAAFRLRQPGSLPILAVAAFLVVGAAVRGIIDLHSAEGDARRDISLVISALLALGCIAFHRVQRSQTRRATVESDGRRARFFSAANRFSLVCWIALSLLFMGGLLAFLLPVQSEFGGHVVIVARTVMEFVLWVLLCNLASKRRTPSTPLFIVWGMSVEIVSWLLSYGLVPRVVADAGEPGALATSTFVLAVMFGIFACALVVFGAYLMLGSDSRPRATAPEAPDEPAAAAAGSGAQRQDGLVDLLIERDRLTYREASVVVRYAHGYSLGKVAQELGITKSTAQSHVKNAYRKLDVHSKDDLIERLGA